MLTVSNLSVYYGAVRALDGVSLEVMPGEIVAMIGANGAGKSTTMRSISGLVKPRSGEITFLGKAIHRLAPHEIVQLGISHAPEGRRVFAEMTVMENLRLGAYVREHSKASVREDLERMFTIFPRLKERQTQLAGTLSGGEQQMLAIARALMARPQLLLLDEPSLGLAPNLVQTIFRVIQEINASGVTILLVEQNANQALRIAHRGYVIETGRIVLEDKAANLLNNPMVRSAYLGETS
ncbi:amino acid/amide ABC transporter ATP-binding protein 2, HAAT family [Chthonomonas calidirosea]|uniref:Amino acid/amide ABC transporter ATP-binding protein 2, HAAT family (TC 3.A.1.4.-) n=1 Tax=Chthonomonas calidirosea (strain DSM 23976 / ICMP 18418 / T49) TaxID=1303518 RepID=S0ESI1_CHTCT|nr:ABC transporter ATP-binding protein [Chthonomonas calidirosea]CCW34256.1 amino acid/amide ABC transporter ATP-binding protein 2, HAAT family (TC 3.A.1.4.-) [Chthonomonas calidirosea T49]CEK14131.1 amino acid/amide ABC transporter ATP-binding protein 2, HAAT family [Chthonomonas calidirosea]CEK15304.1 amino acid/amide ABC transporter ATP-binding protein 2, HAAT family [Chthonomonas calidirosea]